MLEFNNPSFDDTISKEWIVTNGIGGYASSSVNGANTRRYHGLLIASANPPTQRSVLVSKIEECISLKRDTCISISSNRYPNAVHPKGYQYLHSFDRSPFPRTIFEVGGQLIAKTVFMVYGSNTTIIEYENIGKATYKLSLRPIFSQRDYHSLFQQDDYYDFYFDQKDNVLKIHPHFGTAPLFFKYFNGDFTEKREWYKNFEYGKEEYRGLGFQEDGYGLGGVTSVLSPGEKTYLMFTLDEKILNDNPQKLKDAEIKRLKSLRLPSIKNQFFNDLMVSGDQFLVKRASTDSHTILAGYHWFTDWGRDTMIAMRGLCIATGRQEISRSILKTFFNYLNEGMLPNRFPDFADEAVEYNTVDATLWLFVALYEYYEKFGDKAFIKEHFSQLSEILEWHFKGTRFNIHLTKEGFIFAGEGITQLTWMDARVGDYVVTPRHGCPVEIQALWFNALKIYDFFSKELKLGADKLLDTSVSISKKLETNFNKYFVNEAGYLNDVVIPGESADDALRPNQIYVISLPFSLVSKKQEKKIFEIVQKELYTPLGLRTLNIDHPEFKPIYKGDQWHRDTSYHQGTVWPFLLGDYFLAQLKVYNNSAKVRKEVLAAIEPLEKHFYESDCIHGISEIFDGLSPNEGRGTIQQAWSVSGLLLTYLQGNLLKE